MEKKFKMVCSYCGSENVLSDAYAKWNVENQEWELDNTFDKGAFCEDCDGECRIVEKEIVDGNTLIPIN